MDEFKQEVFLGRKARAEAADEDDDDLRKKDSVIFFSQPQKRKFDHTRSLSSQLNAQQREKIGQLANFFDSQLGAYTPGFSTPMSEPIGDPAPPPARGSSASAPMDRSTTLPAKRSSEPPTLSTVAKGRAYQSAEFISLSPTSTRGAPPASDFNTADAELITKFAIDDSVGSQVLDGTTTQDAKHAAAQRELFSLISANDSLEKNNLQLQKRLAELEHNLQSQQSRRHRRLPSGMRHLPQNLQDAQEKIEKLETHNRLLAVELSHLRQAMEEEKEVVSEVELVNQKKKKPRRNRLSMQLMQDFVDKAKQDEKPLLRIQQLEMEVQELVTHCHKKDRKIKELELELNTRSRAELEVLKTAEEDQQRLSAVKKNLTGVQVRLRSTTNENQALRDRARSLNEKTQDQEMKLREFEARLVEEREAKRLADLEKERLTEQLESMGVEKVRQDKTFMNLFDEMMFDDDDDSEYDRQDTNMSGIEQITIITNAETEHSEALDPVYEDDVTLLRSDEPAGNSEELRLHKDAMMKTKPTRQPPAIPKGPAPKLTQEQEAERLAQSEMEFFYMTSIAVKMNLSEFYGVDEIVTADAHKLYRDVKNLKVPMNKFYLYVEDSLRREYSLPGLAFRMKDPKKANYLKGQKGCSIM